MLYPEGDRNFGRGLAREAPPKPVALEKPGIEDASNEGAPSSVQERCRHFVGPQPLFKDDKAEQDFVIVPPAGGMLLEQFAHRSRTKVLVDTGAAVGENLSRGAFQGAAEPIIDDVDGESAL